MYILSLSPSYQAFLPLAVRPPTNHEIIDPFLGIAKGRLLVLVGETFFEEEEGAFVGKRM